MKLYLSSQKLGNRPDLLLNLIGENKNVAVIANAIDDMPSEYRKDRLAKEFDLLKNIGLNPEELDLRNYFNNKKALKKFLETKSLVWIRGGNTFLLSRAFKASGFDKIIKKLLHTNKIVYGGYSAALLIAGKDLSGVEIVDDINSNPTEYPKNTKKLKSLKLFNFYIIPHFNSNESWAKNVKDHINYLTVRGKPIITLCDGEIYYCNNRKKGVIVK